MPTFEAIPVDIKELKLVALLSDPDADSPLNCDAGNMIRGGDMHPTANKKPNMAVLKAHRQHKNSKWNSRKSSSYPLSAYGSKFAVRPRTSADEDNITTLSDKTKVNP